jgi:hypothetical protein
MVQTNLQNINVQTRVLFTKFCKHHPKSAIERFNLPRENGGRGLSNLEILQHNQIASLKNYFLTPLNLSDNSTRILSTNQIYEIDQYGPITFVLKKLPRKFSLVKIATKNFQQNVSTRIFYFLFY